MSEPPVRRRYDPEWKVAPLTFRQVPGIVGRSIRFVWGVGRGYFVVATMLQIINATGAAAQLVAGRDALAVIIAAPEAGTSFASVLGSLVPIGVIGCIRWFASTAGSLVQSYTSEHVNVMGQERLMEVVDQLDLEHFEDSEFFSLLSRARAHYGSAWTLVSGMVGLVGSTFTAIAVVGTLYVFHPLLVMLAAVSGLPMWLASRRNASRSHELNRAHEVARRRVAYWWYLMTSRQEAKEVYAFNMAPELRKRWREMNRELLSERRRLSIRNQVNSTIGSLGSTATAGVTVGFALWLLTTGQLPAAAAAATLYGIQQARSQFSSVLSGLNGIYSTSLFVNDFDAFIKIGEEAARRTPTESGPETFGTITVEGVGYAYPGSQSWALRHISFEIKAGEVVALVGENGSGKTTLAKLLANLYSPLVGRVTWDGRSLTEFEPRSIRDSIAAVFQDFARYRLAAHLNIGLGRIENLDDIVAVKRAAEEAGAASFIDRLSKGYDTVLAREMGDGGTDLSVGQWQRVALARAFFRDARLIILDEPTASLDARAEYDLFERMRTLFAGRTVVLISHRFSNVRMADRIVVLKEGRIIEQGSHDELMNQRGLYAELFDLQASAYLG